MPDEAWACLRAGAEAAHGTGAELQLTSWTTEGDPIVTRYRTGAGIDGIEMTTDSTADSFGEQVVTRQTCADLTTGDTLAVCADG
ncbi:hypothetical protein IC607_14700 [Cellulomonas sp. JH27-2]|uniref:hypothetical protein n=1 Tax=Cellulomonas sp. JH27-2 TaxID=2774139 RepID=UPI001782BA31|nr:hypothetical protein [Cellulomonas sp. JH27-2]MBD8060216.1 hypothetical protein [Cellulomonas sp. JH27-2]